jgi:hypothetical protein
MQVIHKPVTLSQSPLYNAFEDKQNIVSSNCLNRPSRREQQRLWYLFPSHPAPATKQTSGNGAYRNKQPQFLLLSAGQQHHHLTTIQHTISHKFLCNLPSCICKPTLFQLHEEGNI